MVICVTADLTVRQHSSFENVSILLLFALVIATNATEAQICFQDQAGLCVAGEPLIMLLVTAV
jgi:hypothetical protein